MKNRIFGSECEYAIIRETNDGRRSARLVGDAHLEYMKESAGLLVSARDRTGIVHAGEFLGNGGRFYIDRGGHPEYATPECRCILDLVAHEKAGDRLMAELVKNARAVLKEKGDHYRLSVLKNNVDYYGNTFGNHENYLISPKAMDNIHQLVPFLVTRQIFTGNGRVIRVEQQRDYPYELSQRAGFIDCVFCDRTSQIRGIINTRKREIHQPGQNRRLHVIFGDSNMSEYALALKFGTMSLLLRIMEEDALKHVPELENPVDAIKAVARTFDEGLRVRDTHRRYTALDIQSIYLEQVLRFFSSQKPDSEEALLIDLWTNTLELLKHLKLSARNGLLIYAPEPLLRRIDWLAKLQVLNRWQKQQDMDWGNRQLHVIDFNYHDTDPETGIFNRYRDLGMADTLVDPDRIQKAMHHPPKDTRATLRGTIIEKAIGRKIDVRVNDWETIYIRRTGGAIRPSNPFAGLKNTANALEIKLKDPLQSNDQDILKKVDGFVQTWG